MSVSIGGTPFNDSRFNKALNELQTGEWGKGIDELNQLTDDYPDSKDLRSLIDEMKTRSRIDEYEIEENKSQKRKRYTRIAVIAVLAMLAIGLVYFGVSTYSEWMQGQYQLARARIESEAEGLQIAVMYRNGQSFLQSGRTAEALSVFQDIATLDPDYPGLQAYIEQTEMEIELEERYTGAMQLINLNDLEGALVALEEINALEPFYKDVPLRIEEIRNRFFLADILAQADQAYQEENWVQAASSYETVRAIDQLYLPDEIEERLYESYINAAQSAMREDTTSFENLQEAESYFNKALALRPRDPATKQERAQLREIFRTTLADTYVSAAKEVLQNQEDSLQAVAAAEEYFRKALALQPKDPEILKQQNLSQRFISAQNDFGNKIWSEVISSLEYVYSQEPSYAYGTSLQTLYEAYVARGDDFVAFGDYEEALSDYTRAASIAKERDDPGIGLYSTQIKTAEVYGKLGDYENAVFAYEDAIESLPIEEGLLEDYPKIQADLDRANNYTNQRYYRLAYQTYNRATPQILPLFSSFTYVIQSGEYLTMLANRYNTTIDAIIEANNLSNPKQIEAGQEIIIPGTEN